MHPYNRAWDAIFPLKKELYMPEDIVEIEKATNRLIAQFRSEGIYILNGLNTVHGIGISYLPVSNTIRYVDMDTVQVQVIVR